MEITDEMVEKARLAMADALPGEETRAALEAVLPDIEKAIREQVRLESME